MSKAPTKVINNGRVTIPAEVRKELGLQQGDYVIIEIEPLEKSD